MTRWLLPSKFVLFRTSLQHRSFCLVLARRALCIAFLTDLSLFPSIVLESSPSFLDFMLFPSHSSLSCPVRYPIPPHLTLSPLSPVPFLPA
jgi:hypothetical protein